VGVVGEADGRVKYRLAALERGGLDPEGLARALDDERRREAGLRRAGALVVRWGARDILRPPAAEALVDHLRGQIELAGRLNQFTGLVVQACGGSRSTGRYPARLGRSLPGAAHAALP
jgi:hypothetical protein